MENLADGIMMVMSINAAKTRMLALIGCLGDVIKFNKIMSKESTDNEYEVLIRLLLECCGSEGE